MIPANTRSLVAVLAAAFLAAAAVTGCASKGDPVPVDRSAPPSLGPPDGLQLPPVVSREMPNGLRLMMVEHHELPVVNFIMLVASGPETDPADKLGLATLTSALLDDGTTTRNALAIADQAAFLGASLGSSSGWDASRVALQTITSQLDSALALYADVILRPSFPDEELDRLRRERLTSILQIQDSPPQVADLAFARVVFGDAHPYGRSQVGTEKTVTSITRDDIANFYRQQYLPNNSTLIIVGDFRPSEMEKRIETLFSGWQRGEVKSTPVPVPEARTGTKIYLVDKPNSPQSSVRVGHVGAARATPEYFGLYVANTVLGGSFTSRLNMNLREAKAFTYGASSVFDMRDGAGPFVARAEVFSAKTDSAVIEFIKELNAIRDTVPSGELEKAKQYLQLQLPDAFETTSDIATRLVPVALYGLPLNYYDSFAQSIGAVTQSDARRVMETHVRPGQLAIVIVGDRKAIEPALRKLNAGPIELRDIHGAPVR